jgi:hypothetical protein
MTSVAPPTEFFPGINFNASFYNLGQSAVTLDYLNSNFLRSTGYAISRAQYTLFNGSVNIQQNLDVSQNINAGAYALNGVPVTFSQWTTSVNDIYYTTGNVGIGKTNPSATYKLDVSGNINADKIFRAGTELTQYTDTNVRTVLSTSAGTNMTWNTGTNKFDVAAPYTDTNTRTVLSTSAGTNMTWNTGTNKFDVAAPYILPIATNVTLGGVKSGNDISVNPTTGIMSLSGNDIYLNGTTNREYSWSGSNSSLGRAATAQAYSTSSIINDLVLRSAGNLILQSGVGASALIINTSNQAFFRNALCIAGTAITAGSVLDITGNSIMRNALVVGGTTITSGYTLDVKGDVITSGNINLANTSRSLFWGGTNSNLGRAGVGGEYSTSAAINDIVLRSGNKLILQSGVGAAGIVIDTANNVGIGIATPNNTLHLHKTATLQDVRLQITDGTSTTGSARGLVVGKGTDNRSFVYNYENTSLFFGTNALERMTITNTGNVGIGNTAPIAPLCVGNSALANNDGFLVLEKCTTVGTTRQFRIGLNANFELALGDYGGGNVAGTWLQALRIGYQSPSNSLVIGANGNISILTGMWHNSSDGLARVYYVASGTTYLKGHGTDPLVFRNGADTDLVKISSNGNVGIGTYYSPNYKLDVNGEINATNVRVNGVDINQMIKNQHLFSIYRVSITNYYLNFVNYWEGVWDIGTNLVFNEYNRPQLNVRWNISGSINNGNGNDSNKYFFMNYFYNQLGNNIAFNTTHSYGQWSFQNFWNGSGNNFLRIICRLDSPADYLNVNIS